MNIFEQIIKLYKEESIKVNPFYKTNVSLAIISLIIFVLCGWFDLSIAHVLLVSFVLMALALISNIFIKASKSNDQITKTGLSIFTFTLFTSLAISMLFMCYIGWKKRDIIADSIFPNTIKTASTSDSLQNSRTTLIRDTINASSSIISTVPETDEKNTTILQEDELNTTNIADGLYDIEKENPYLIYKGIKISFFKVSGNFTKKNYPIDPYFLSEPLPNKILIEYSRDNASNSPTPMEYEESKPINLIHRNDLLNISKQMNCSVASFVDIVNAELGKSIYIGPHAKAIYYEAATTNEGITFGEITVNPKLANVKYISDDHVKTIIQDHSGKLLEGYVRLSMPIDIIQ